MIKVFLGGTCAGNTEWRKELIEQLDIDYFNPVVEDWTPACMEEEVKQRNICDFVLYTITPSMEGVYSIAEVVEDSNKQPHKTIFCVLESYEGQVFSLGQMKSLRQVGKLVSDNGGMVLYKLTDVANYLNNVALVDEEL